MGKESLQLPHRSPSPEKRRVPLHAGQQRSVSMVTQIGRDFSFAFCFLIVLIMMLGVAWVQEKNR